MTLAIDPKLEKIIHDQVKAGRFSSANEAVEAGIARLMHDRDPDFLDEQDIRTIRAALQCVDRGEATPASEVHARLERKFVGNNP